MVDYKNLKEELPDIKENISLKGYTSFHIGGEAKYFLEINEEDKLIKAIKMAKNFSLPFFVLGGGSNLLISDRGYNGMVIRLKNSELEIKDSKKDGEILIECGAGLPLSKLLSFAVEHRLSGLEWAIGIPGTVGGAIRGNAGAFGRSMSDVIEKVKILESNKLIFADCDKQDCEFSYRNSLLKKYNNLIITSALIRLKKGDEKDTKNKIQEYLNYRKDHQPLSFPSAGSIFKNYQGVILDSNLLKEFPELSEFNKKKIIPAGYLIDKCGLRKKIIGQAQISEKHANFIINLGEAKSSDVIRLIDFIQDKVKEKFGIDLKREIEIIG